MKHIKIEEYKNNIVKKSELLIKNVRYEHSELCIKVISLLISMINTKDEDFKRYRLEIKDFKELIGTNSNRTYEYVHKLNRELMSKPFTIEGKTMNWCIIAEHKKGDSTIAYEIHPSLKPYLLQLKKNFLQYNVYNILKLNSIYLIRLYELLKDELEKSTRFKRKNEIEFIISIDELRDILNIPETYQYSSGIKKRILEKAKKEFREKTDINFSYKDIKNGNKFEKLIITINENNKGSNDYMMNKKTFINHIRKNFINADIYKAIENGKTIQIISVSPDGKLYDKTGKDFDSSRSNEIWNTLYELGKSKKLEIQL